MGLLARSLSVVSTETASSLFQVWPIVCRFWAPLNDYLCKPEKRVASEETRNASFTKRAYCSAPHAGVPRAGAAASPRSARIASACLGIGRAGDRREFLRNAAGDCRYTAGGWPGCGGDRRRRQCLADHVLPDLGAECAGDRQFGAGRPGGRRWRYGARRSAGPPIADLERPVLDPLIGGRLPAFRANHRLLRLGAAGRSDRRAVFASDDGHGRRAGGAVHRQRRLARCGRQRARRCG